MNPQDDTVRAPKMNNKQMGKWGNKICSQPLEYRWKTITAIRKMDREGFPGGTVVKNLPANARDMGSSPGPGRSHMPRSN